jgi:alginate O-acetyltransferase complex protein AlgI
MVFSSPGFLFGFLPLFFILYCVLPRAWRNVYVLLASFAFYMLGAGAMAIVALVLLLANWLLAFPLGRAQAGAPRRARVLLGIGIAMNLLPLMFYKYLGFVAQLLGDLVGVELAPAVRQLGIVLPLGISFYVFHFLSYLLDVHAGRIRPELHLHKFAIYIFLFPHLIAGPVVRFAEVKEQLDVRRRRLVNSDVFWGTVIFALGLAKKVLVADPLGSVVDQLHQPGFVLSTYAAWLGAICYSFQIYFDFSGYTDMAVGMARIMGFRFPRNFNRPYASASITEFWQRWHMTLSRFFRDYVYIPLGGNRTTPVATYRNLLIVFVLCALWHGAAYTFLVWGVGHGVLLVLERGGVLNMQRWRLGSLPTFVVATLLWVPFRAESLAQTRHFWRTMLGVEPGTPVWADSNRVLADPKVLALLALAFAVCLIGDRPFARMRRASFRYPVLMGCYAAGLYALACISVVERGFNPFIYFQF